MTSKTTDVLNWKDRVDIKDVARMRNRIKRRILMAVENGWGSPQNNWTQDTSPEPNSAAAPRS